MSIATNQAELTKLMQQKFTLLMTKLRRVPAALAYQPNMPGHAKGTTMSVAQLVAYLIGWGEQVLTWHRQESRGEKIDFPARGFKWNQLGLLAQKYYGDYAHIADYAELLNVLADNHRQLLSLVNGLDDEALYGAAWCGKYTRGRMIQFNTAAPYQNAVGRLNALFKSGVLSDRVK